MRDYGFTTYDENGKKIDGFVNSKYPIFGPKYNKISSCFKTFHIVDTTSHTLDQIAHQEPPQPSGNIDTYDVQNVTRGFVKEKIIEFEHGLGFRPLGYVYFDGKIVRTTTMRVTQTEVVGTAYSRGEFGGDFDLTGYDVYKTIARPDIKEQIMDTSLDTSYMASSFSVCYGTEGYNNGDTVRVNNNVSGWFTTMYDVISYGMYGEPEVPYVAEIDDKYVRIYRYICWSDYKARIKVYYSSAINYDLNQRIKLCTSYEGSELNATIYLCPYKMEDLL